MRDQMPERYRDHRSGLSANAWSRITTLLIFVGLLGVMGGLFGNHRTWEAVVGVLLLAAAAVTGSRMRARRRLNDSRQAKGR